jgi:hypothetical protein
VRFTLDLESADLEMLETQAAREEVSVAAVIRRVLRRYLGRRRRR